MLDEREGRALSFGEFRLFPDLRLLTKAGRKVELGGRAFQVLAALLDAEGEILSKDELLSGIWRDDVVDENNLQAQVSAVRRVLGEDRGWLSTVFGRGYRLSVPGGVSRRPIGVPALPPYGRGGVPAPIHSDLPAAIGSLVGREAELAALSEDLEAHALVTVAGAGGIGKTRVAVELGRRSRALFEAGVVLIELAAVTEPGLVLPTLAARLNVEATTRGFSRRACEGLCDRRMLVILDNCEHLLEEVADAVEQLLRIAPRARLLTTTQEPLGIAGEQIFRLRPLGVPPTDAVGLDDVRRYASAELLVQRVQASDRQLRLTDAHAAGLAAVSRRLDGIPLAIELAAARIAQVGLTAVVAGLSDRFNLLTAGRRTAIPRHQTLRATLDWSYGLLTEAERALLRRLGVFAGPFTLDAVRGVACPEAEGPWAVADCLGGLVEKSIVVRDVDRGQARFRLLETVRAFALEKLAATDDLAATVARHVAHFHARLLLAADRSRSLPSAEWLAEFADDLGDVRAALDLTSTWTGDPAAAIRALCASLPFWMGLSLLDECRMRVEQTIERFADVLAEEPHLETQLRAALGASSTWARGPVPEAKASWMRCLDLAEREGDAEYRLQAHYGLWLHALRSGRYAQALRWAEVLAQAGTATGDPQARMAGTRTVGVSRHFLGDHSEAIQILRALVLRPGDLHDGANALRFGLDQRTAGLAFLARAHWIAGEPAQAAEMAAQAVAAAEALDHATTLCCALLEGQCTISALARDLSALDVHAAAAVKIADAHGLGFWRLYGQAFRDLAALVGERSFRNVTRLLDDVAQFREVGFSLNYSVFGSELAEALGACGREYEALALINEVLAPSAADGRCWGTGEFERVKATLLQRSTRCRA